MATIYDVPPIGLKNGFKQKGPTCWYYASKMLLKFHGKLDKKDSEFYAAFKRLHELRTALTAMSDQTRKERGEKAKVLGTMTDSLDPAKQKIDEIDKKLGACPESGPYRDGLLKVKQMWESKRPDADRSKRIAEAIKLVEDLTDDWSNRLNLLSAFVPTAGFVTKNEDKVFENPTKLGEFLGIAGPFYAGGELSMTVEFDDPNPTPAMEEFAQAMKVDVPLEKTANRGKTLQEQGTTDSGTKVYKVSNVTPSSGHAVVVVGVDGDTVFYKDPNYSDKVMMLPFDKFKAAVKSVIALACSGCTHKTKTTVI